MRSASLSSDCVGTSDETCCRSAGLETSGGVIDDAAVDVGSKERGGGGLNAVSGELSDCSEGGDQRE